MLPHGDSRELAGTPTLYDVQALLDVLKADWPGAVLDFALADLRPGGLPTDFFVYRDENWQTDWSQKGWSEFNGAAMIHVIVSDDSLCLVTEAEALLLAERALKAVAAARSK